MPAAAPGSTFGQRLLMYVLEFGYIISTKTIRAALPSIVPFIAADKAWSPVQQAMLLSGFYQGYVITQVPAAPLVQRWGAKPVLSGSLAGTAAAFLAVPWLSGAGPLPVAAVLAVMGLAQGPLAAGCSQINRDWMPHGTHEHNWAGRGIGMAHTCSPLVAAFLTPRLVAMGGTASSAWKAACYSLGGACAGFTVL
eukprot:SAG22_NODE_6354_length_866_cov_1.568449_1_plen_194_part_10